MFFQKFIFVFLLFLIKNKDTDTSFTVIASILLGTIWITVLATYTIRFYITHKGQRKLYSEDIQKIFDKEYNVQLRLNVTAYFPGKIIIFYQEHTSILNNIWSGTAKRTKDDATVTSGRLSSKYNLKKCIEKHLLQIMTLNLRIYRLLLTYLL